MKRLLGLLLVMGIVGCGGGDDAPMPNHSQAKIDEPPVQAVDTPPAGEAALPATPKNEPHAKVAEPPVQTVDASKLVPKDGLMYEGDSETPFTGVVVAKHENGQKASETTFKDGKPEGLATMWHKNGQKRSETTFKDGKPEGPTTMWYDNGQKWEEANYKDGKPEGPYTSWHKNGQKQSEATFKDGKLVSETKWDEEGNEIKK